MLYRPGLTIFVWLIALDHICCRYAICCRNECVLGKSCFTRLCPKKFRDPNKSKDLCPIFFQPAPKPFDPVLLKPVNFAWFTFLCRFGHLGSGVEAIPFQKEISGTSSATKRALPPKNQIASIVFPWTVYCWRSYSFERGPPCGCMMSSLISALPLGVNFVSLFAYCLSPYLSPPIVSLLLLWIVSLLLFMIVLESNLNPGLFWPKITSA